MFTLRNQGRPTDSLAVSAELTRRGDYGKAGGDEAMVDLLKVAALSVDATHYAQIIRQYAIRRALIVAAHEIIADCYNLDLTAEEVVNRAEARLFAIGERGVGVKVLARIESEADDVIARAARRRAGEFAGVPTGIDGLDDITDGLQPGNLVILAARPSIGKTALALAVAWNAARRAGIGSAVFSLEMSNLDLCERLIVMASGVDGHKIRTGSYLTASEEQAIAQAAREVRDCETLWFTDAAMIGPEQVLSQCRRLKRRRGLGLVVVDYMQLMTPPADVAKRASRQEQVSALSRRLKRRRGLGLVVVDYMQLMTPPADVAKRASRQEQVSALSRRLKLVAGELGVPVLVLSQLNRLAEGRADKRPMLSDLRESGAIEQDADVVLLLHRPEFYDATDRPGEAELIVAKNRNGRTGTIRLAYRKACAAFENHVPNFGPPPTGEPY
jgi:replicative DNA helicase